MRLSIVLAVTVCCSSHFVEAEVKWTSRNVELRPKPDEPQVVATFPFTNAGSEAVTITSLRTSCDCTTASLAKHTPTPE